jgi:hypothetical protein
MPIHDSALVIRTDTAVFVSSVPETVSLELNATGLKGLAVHIRVPSAVTGSDPILACWVHASSTSAAASTDSIIASRTGMVKAAEYIVPFSTPLRAIAVRLDVTSSTTTAFSKITADIVENVGQDWKRTVEFH